MLRITSLRSRPNRSALAAFGAASVLLLSACGGSDGDADAAVDVTNDAATTTLVGASETESSDEAAEPADVATADLDRYCELRNTASTASDEFFAGDLSFDPVEMEQFVQDQIGYITEATTVAPAELLPDLAIQIEGLNDLDALLAENDYDIVAVAAELPSVMETPERDASSDRLNAFSDENCPEPEPTVTELTDGTDDEAEDASGNGADGSDGGVGGFSEEDLAEAESIIEVLRTEEGRVGFIEVVTEEGQVNEAQAGCLIDNLTPQLLLEIDVVDRDGADAATPAVLEVFDLCDIVASEFAS